MIGVLAVLLNTGKLAIFVVPHPDVIRQEQKLEKESPVFCKSNKFAFNPIIIFKCSEKSKGKKTEVIARFTKE